MGSAHTLDSSAAPLLKDGYIVAPGLVPTELVARLQKVCSVLTGQLSAEERAANRSLGSLVSIWRDPIFAELATLKPALHFLASLGFRDLRFSAGYIFSKPPHSPPTFWHQDWWCWDEPGSYVELPLQIGLLFYLQDTHKQNGALRVIPGSHRRIDELHREFAKRNKLELRAAKNESDIMFKSRSDERCVEVRAGDFVVFDARLMHSAYANQSDAERQAVTLWYFPFYSSLSERLRATIGSPNLPQEWPQSAKDNLLPLTPSYSGSALTFPVNEHPDTSMFS